MMHSKIDEIIKSEWRELGFYYDQDKSNQAWLLFGSKKGLLNFVHILEEYTNEPYNASISNDEHYGPYSYLKICTWETPSISEDNIGGTILSLKNLSIIIFDRLSSARVGDEIVIDKEFSDSNSYKLKLIIMQDDFDPVSKDPNYN